MLYNLIFLLSILLSGYIIKIKLWEKQEKKSKSLWHKKI